MFIDYIHNDDLGEIAGKIYAGASIDGMPIRTWYIEKTLKRHQEDVKARVLRGAKSE